MDLTVILLFALIILLAVVNAALTIALIRSPYAHTKSREYQEMLEMKENTTANLVKPMREVRDFLELFNDMMSYAPRIQDRGENVEKQIERLISYLAEKGISERER